MLELLRAFAGLTLLSGALLSLIPQGSLRRAAGMAVGLMMLMLWSQGLQELGLSMPGAIAADTPSPPAVLQPSGTGLSEAERAALSTLTSQEVPAHEP